MLLHVHKVVVHSVRSFSQASLKKQSPLPGFVFLKRTKNVTMGRGLFDITFTPFALGIGGACTSATMTQGYVTYVGC